MAKYNELVEFIKTNHPNPSRYVPEERGKYLNWLKANCKLMNAGGLKDERRQNDERRLKYEG